MLQQFRRGANSLVAKILMGMLVLSFGLWGIGDIFRNFGGHTLAKVGRTEVSIEHFRSDYDRERQQLARRAGQAVTNEQAEALGLRGRVLGQLLTEAAFDEQARRMGLNVSKGLIVRDIMQDPAFFGPAGTFDRMKFERLLYGNNYNEAMYVQDRIALAKRRMLAESLTSSAGMPDIYVQALHRLKNEARTADYILLTADRFAKIAPSSNEELVKYYDVVKPAYNTIERRSLKLLTLKADDFAKAVIVSDDEARNVYDSQADKYSKPERREIEQVIFPDDKIAEIIGTPPKASVIDTLVKENKITRNSLGLLTKKEIIDPAVSEAAFSLPLNTYSKLIKGQFGPIIVRVAKIEPGETTSFDKAKVDIKHDIAMQRARDTLFDMHDKIENERASGARLDEIAAKLKLSVTTTPAVDKTGIADMGNSPIANGSVAQPVEPAVLEDAFQAEQGTDNEPIQLPNHNWVWFEVDQIIPERERPLSEVRKQVEEQWLENQQRIALSEKAHGILDDIRKGKTLEAVARELQVPLKTTAPFTREGKVPDFSASAINTAFRIAVGAAETGLAGSNKDRVVFIVKKAETPGTPQIDDKLAKNIADGMRDDLLYQFIASVQQTQGMTVNNELAERLTSGTSP